MPINHSEIIEDFKAHMGRFGGAPSVWWVGTAKDARAPFFRRHLTSDPGDALFYREAYTTTAAALVVEHLVNHRGVHEDRDSVPEPGKFVFVYRKLPVVSSHLSATSTTVASDT